MPRLRPIDLTNAPTDTQKLLADVEDKLGMAPNLIATMAQSTSVARAYVNMVEAFSVGVLSESLRERIALTVSQANRCGCCAAGHAAIGSSVGLTDDEVRDARNAASPDRKTEGALQFARRIVGKRGRVSDGDINEVREAGYGEIEIVEIVAHVALNIFTNYFNLVAQTEIDFPPVAKMDE